MSSLVLPYPPSGNRAVRHANGAHYIPEPIKNYRKAVWVAVQQSGIQYPATDRLAVVCELSPPDRRIRDLDNPWKTLADAITKAGGWQDDSQIDDLRIIRRQPIKNGSAIVYISALDNS